MEEEKIIASFGIWNVVENVGITVPTIGVSEYFVDASTLWDTGYADYSDTKLGLYVWPIDIVIKTWATETINDFNTAFCFAQSYFKDQYPEKSKDGSFHETILVQKKLLNRYK